MHRSSILTISAASCVLFGVAAVRLNPAFPTSHLNLGLALVRLGSLDEAESQFEETLRLEPGNSRAADYLAQVRALKKDRQK